MTPGESGAEGLTGGMEAPVFGGSLCGRHLQMGKLRPGLGQVFACGARAGPLEGRVKDRC